VAANLMIFLRIKFRFTVALCFDAWLLVATKSMTSCRWAVNLNIWRCDN